MNNAVPPSGDGDTANCNVQDAVHANAATYDHVSYWHFVLEHTGMMNRKLYADTDTDLHPPLTAQDIKHMKDFFCHICALGKSTHHVPPLYDTPSGKTHFWLIWLTVAYGGLFGS